MEILKSRFAGGYQIRILVGSLFATVVADGLITEFLVRNGFGWEANPLLSDWVAKDAFLTLKLVGGFLAALYLLFMYRRQPKLSIWVSAFFLTVYTIIIFWNLLILR